MSGFVIRARGLVKEYLVAQHRASTLKERVVRARSFGGPKRPFRALDDVSFELAPGRSLAIMGGNGSGKSTLLKLISGIIVPDAGSIEVNGRVAALLELGAAFQEEFTGMENIFLQCSIFGMKRREILRCLDDIIAFSELEKFIHTPVKKYSSGMFMRLAFAIALHLDTEIIALDEVLAVGDQAFQVKCRRRIEQEKEAGKTILFVSHLLEQVEGVADEMLWLEAGKARGFGPVEDLLPRYYESLQETESLGDSGPDRTRFSSALPSARFEGRRARIASVAFLDSAGRPARHFPVDSPFRIELEMEVNEHLPGLRVLAALGTADSVRAGWADSGPLVEPAPPGRYRATMTIHDAHLRPGFYIVSLLLCAPADLNTHYDVIIRLHAISLTGGMASIGTPRVLPFGRFALPPAPGGAGPGNPPE